MELEGDGHVLGVPSRHLRKYYTLLREFLTSSLQHARIRQRLMNNPSRYRKPFYFWLCRVDLHRSILTDCKLPRHYSEHRRDKRINTEPSCSFLSIIHDLERQLMVTQENYMAENANYPLFCTIFWCERLKFSRSAMLCCVHFLPHISNLAISATVSVYGGAERSIRA